jgi:hypothetical protein
MLEISENVFLRLKLIVSFTNEFWQSDWRREAFPIAMKSYLWPLSAMNFKGVKTLERTEALNSLTLFGQLSC